MIYIDQRANGNFGIGRFSMEIGQRFVRALKFKGKGSPFSFLDPFLLHIRLPSDAKFFISTNVSGPFLGRVPYAVCIHDLVQLDLPQYFPFFKRLYFNVVTRLVAKKAAIVFTVSDFSKQRICHHFSIPESKVVVLGNAAANKFAIQSFGATPVVDFKYFLNYSSAKKYKNLQGLIKAYSAIESRVKEDLIIVANRKQISPQISLSNRIHFMDNLSDDDLVGLLSHATALVFPSHYEGFGIPIIEAMACGCPVITSNSSSMPEVAQGAAILVDPKSSASIADAMLYVSSIEVDARKKMIRDGLRVCGKYSWENIVLAMEESVIKYMSVNA